MWALKKNLFSTYFFFHRILYFFNFYFEYILHGNHFSLFFPQNTLNERFWELSIGSDKSRSIYYKDMKKVLLVCVVRRRFTIVVFLANIYKIPNKKWAYQSSGGGDHFSPSGADHQNWSTGCFIDDDWWIHGRKRTLSRLNKIGWRRCETETVIPTWVTEIVHFVIEDNPCRLGDKHRPESMDQEDLTINQTINHLINLYFK